MKNWQFFSLMWILSMICYYVGDKQYLAPLIAGSVFIGCAALTFIFEDRGKR